MPQTPVLDVRNLTLHYLTSKGPVHAVDDVSFHVSPGETLGIVGESGCGKTTLGTALLGMPAAPGRIVGGSVVVDGIDIVGMGERELRRRIRWEKVSMVFQGAMNTLTPVYTIAQQMAETMRQHGRAASTRDEVRRRIAKYLGLVGLPAEVADRYPHELSGGMKQRIVIAMALFLEPKLVILDEPTTALDVIVQAQIINLLKELKRGLSLSMVFITHDLATVAEVADRVLVMYAGKVAEIGGNGQIYGAPAPAGLVEPWRVPSAPCHPYTRRLLAATPRLHAKVNELSFIPGAPPDLLDPPAGCRFQPRCPVAFEKCARQPPLGGIEPGHTAACWRCVDG